MKRLLLAAAALAMLGGVATAGPNANGALIVHANPGIVVSTDPTNYCGQSGLVDCETAINSLPLDDSFAWFVLAAFSDNASPRVAGITFGVVYTDVSIAYSGGCGDFELSDSDWPASGSGTAVTWNTAQTSQLVDVYYFVGYGYGNCANFGVGPHPAQGGMFADDDTPANLDPIAFYGRLGFGCPGATECPQDGADPTGACCLPDFGPCVVVTEVECGLAGGAYQGDGSDCDPNPCPLPPQTGACCIGEECSITTAADCTGEYKGDGTDCDPNPCIVIPTDVTSWGQIKNTYR